MGKGIAFNRKILCSECNSRRIGTNWRREYCRIDVYNLTSQGWETTTALSQARYLLAAASSGDLILFGGGFTSSGESNVVDIYTVATRQWLTADMLSIPRRELTATSHGELIFFAGGYGLASYRNVLDVYNVTSKDWVLGLGTLSVARSSMASASSSSGDVVLFAGGADASNYYSVVDVFNVTSMAWETPLALSVGRSKLAAASIGDLLFFAGGSDLSTQKAEIDIYNVTLSGWTGTVNLAVARSELAGASTNSFVAFAGGYDGSLKRAEVDYYDIQTKKWSQMSLSQARIGITGTGTEKGVAKAFFAGGLWSGASDKVDIFSLQSEPLKLYEPRSHLSAASATSKEGLGEEFVLLGGGLHEAHTGTVDFLNESTMETSLDFLSIGRYDLAASAVEDLILFAGGESSSGYSDRVDGYNCTSQTWINTSSLSAARYSLVGASAGSVVLFAGGTNGTLCDVVDVFNASDSSWFLAGPLSVARYLLAVATLNDELVLFAGGWDGSANHDEVDIYNVSSSSLSGNWSSSETDTLSIARSIVTGASYGDFAIFAGGATTTGNSAVADMYRYSTKSWSTASISEARYGMAGGSSNGFIMFAGGEGVSVSSVVDIFDTKRESWATSELRIARRYLAGVGTRKAVYFVGGIAGDSKTNVIDVFITSLADWSGLSEARSRLTATSSASSAYSEGVALFAGGIGSAGYSPTVEVYDEALDEWTRGFLSVRRSDLASASLNGELFLIAGGEIDDSGVVSDRVDLYNHTDRKWTIASLSQARSHLAAAAAIANAPLGGGIVLVGGGWDGSDYSDVVDLYNLTSSSWSTSVLSMPRSRLAATSSSNTSSLVFFAGGINIYGAVERVDIYNATTSSWTIKSLLEPRYDISAATNGNFAVFAGGYGSTTYSDLVEMYNMKTSVWSASKLSQARSKLVAISTDEGISCSFLFTGGESGAGVSQVVDIFDTSTMGWSVGDSLSVARTSLAAASTSKKFIIAGGRTQVTQGTEGTEEGSTRAIDIVNMTACPSTSSSSGSSGMTSSSSTGGGSSQSQSQSRSSTAAGSSSSISSSQTGSTPSGGCMSSSAVKGTKMESKLWKMRKFKDEKLNKHVVGRTLIKIYYEVSPFGKTLVERSALVKYSMRIVLMPMLWMF